MPISKERKRFLKQELKEYEKRTPMTQDERRELHEWINAGYSVHEIPVVLLMMGTSRLIFLIYTGKKRHCVKRQPVWGVKKQENMYWITMDGQKKRQKKKNTPLKH